MVSHAKSLAEEFRVRLVHVDCKESEEGEPKHYVPHLACTAAIVVSRRSADMFDLTRDVQAAEEVCLTLVAIFLSLEVIYSAFLLGFWV